MKKFIAILTSAAAALACALVVLMPAPAQALTKSDCFRDDQNGTRFCLKVYYYDDGRQWRITSHSLCASGYDLEFDGFGAYDGMYELFSYRGQGPPSDVIGDDSEIHRHWPDGTYIHCWTDPHDNLYWRGDVEVDFTHRKNNWPDDRIHLGVHIPFQ